MPHPAPPRFRAPVVTELRPTLEPVTHDPFLDDLPTRARRRRPRGAHAHGGGPGLAPPDPFATAPRRA